MGRHKEEILRQEEARYRNAEAAGRRCVYCGSVIAFGDEVPGVSRVCSRCEDYLNKDD